MLEIKYIKNTTLCETLRMLNPAKDRHKRMRIERAMLNFHPGPGKHASSPRKIDAIDRDFLFGNALQPSSHRGCSAFPLAFVGLTGKQGLSPRIH